MKRTHGESHGSRTYRIWTGMRSRCLNPTNHSYARYGGRGVTVCERWTSYEAFLADMGYAPEGHSIERVDNAGGYEPSNCRWIPMAEQARNKRNNVWITANGITRLLEDWSRETGIAVTTIWMRINARGWTPERAVLTPVKR